MTGLIAGQKRDDDEDLFHLWIHPVLDLSHVLLDNVKNPNVEALNFYLRTALAERDAETRHRVAEEIRRSALLHSTNAPWVQDCHHIADRIHPEHGDENDCTDFHEDSLPIALDGEDDGYTPVRLKYPPAAWKNQVLHEAIEKLRAHKKTLPEHWAGARIDDLIALIHPEHDGECDA